MSREGLAGFARIQKILAAKEVKQQYRRQQQQQQQQAQAQEQRRSSLLEQSSSTELFDGVSSQENGQGLESEGRAAKSNESTTDRSLGTQSSVFVSSHQKTLQRSFSYPRSAPNRMPLTMAPPSLQLLLSNDKDYSTVMESITTVTTHELADLFSTGEMPFIETPFPSHDRINEWKDPCFDDEESEDSGVDGLGPFIQDTSSSCMYRPSVAVPQSSLLSMLERLGIMDFFSDAFPTDTSFRLTTN